MPSELFWVFAQIENMLSKQMSFWEENEALPMFFIAVIFDFTCSVSGKPLQKRKCRSKTHVCTLTRIWMPTYFTLSSGYVKCSCRTHPGQVWSIQLALFVAGTSLITPVELFWNKWSLSKCFLVRGPWVTLQPGISSSVHKYIVVFVKQRRDLHCMSCCYFFFFHIKIFEVKINGFIFLR